MTDMGHSLYRLLADNLARDPDRTALIDAKRKVTYADFSAEVDLVADYLTGIGITQGDRVIVHLRKSIEEAVAMWATAKIGAVVINVNTQWTSAQLRYVAEDSGAKALIISGQPKDLPSTMIGTLIQNPKGPLEDTQTDWATLKPTGTGKEATPTDTDLAMIIYTSGSTGMPKGVMLSHRNIRIGAETVVEYLGLTKDDRLLSVLPYSFDAGLNQLTTMLLVGGSIVHQPVIMPTEIIKAINTHQVTGFAGVPPLWNQVVRLLAKTPTALPTLRLITNTGGKIPPDILSQMPDVFPDIDIFLMYGLTEAFRSTYLPAHKFAAKMGAIGQGVPNADIHVIKHGQGRAGPGEQGELVHAGPLVSLGYWGRPDLTAEKIKTCPELADLIGDEPVVYSGDLVRVDEDGDLWFVSRVDDMIKTSGFRLSPTEVEDLISASGMATDIVAFGVDDDDLGQVVHVTLTPQPNYDEAALIAHCRKTMPAYMVPRKIIRWDGPMPRTASGKLDRPQVIAASRQG
ncbi:AMP-binding protein [Yoonia sp. 2307UL14-13]|uniref:AMP-binding protein n=1 Tax=Yoonia sp. 2307UL14-13 TaxID=3126506 RepID=UPI0030956B70